MFMTSCKFRFFVCNKEDMFPKSIIFASDCPDQIKDFLKKSENKDLAVFTTTWVPLDVFR
jgi:hypothetical protein